MSNDKHYNPAIYARLQKFAAEHDWQGIFLYLCTLSNAYFRTAGYILGERIFPVLPEDESWALAITLVREQPKAFLVTMLKAIYEGLTSGSLHLRSNGSKIFLVQVKDHPLDVQKTLLKLLPAMRRPEDVIWLFRQLEMEEGEPRLPYLMRTPTLPSAYVLFRTLHYIEHDRALLVRMAHFLMKRGDGPSFNLASLMKVYYGLDELKGTFSLRLEPFQLARIDNSYDAFCEIMRR